MKFMITAICVAFLWLAWPYWTLYSFATALQTGDAVALDGHVAWPEVRQGLKEDFSAIVASSAAEELAENPFAGLGMMLGGAMIDRLVDSYVTPGGLALLIKKNLEGSTADAVPSEQSNLRKTPFHNLRWAFFNGPASFLVILQNKERGNAEQPLQIVMKLRELQWKIVRIYLPPDLQNTVAER